MHMGFDGDTEPGVQALHRAHWSMLIPGEQSSLPCYSLKCRRAGSKASDSRRLEGKASSCLHAQEASFTGAMKANSSDLEEGLVWLEMRCRKE